MKLDKNIIKKIGLFGITALIIICRFLFSKNISNFFIKNSHIDDELMVNQMMLLGQRHLFRKL